MSRDTPRRRSPSHNSLAPGSNPGGPSSKSPVTGAFRLLALCATCSGAGPGGTSECVSTLAIVLIAAASGPFGWSPETWVALCTGGLAVATFFLAVFTWRMARATISEVSVTVRPLLVDAPVGIFLQEQQKNTLLLFRRFHAEENQSPTEIVDAGRLHVSTTPGQAVIDFAIRNAGSGPALVREVVAEGSNPAIEISHSVIPLGEPVRLRLAWSISAPTPNAEPAEPATRDTERKEAVTKAEDFLDALSSITVRVVYTDMTGRQPTTSRFKLTSVDELWGVRSITLLRRKRFRRERQFAQLTRRSLNEYNP
jgi:hypothetical protein